ncbi:hypothetical protein GALMADRAFT_148897 [Galerina marginata CBS 339.88]|uniref:Uncharacterized protein n=1 Tax=Galerina marginata (strain CBS 339.88) TaxID=685588 RepID=A0A067SEJ1_GALM3|nr:hypothetical protein GALMADRAFT_148897 [Galerina marginata CBS 339.88]
MASKTPVILSISTFSQELGNLLAASFVELEKKPVDRITSVSWEMKMLSDIGDQHKLIAPIKTWLSRSISMDIDNLSVSELLQFFLGNQFLQRYDPERAIEYLEQLQHIMDKKQFGSNQPQHHQLNYLEDITEHDFLSQKDSAEFNLASGDGSDNDSDYEDLDSGSISFNPQSPPRKRQKKPQQTANQSEKTTFANPSLSSTTFEAFNNMAILSRNHDVWNQILQENPSFGKRNV